MGRVFLASTLLMLFVSCRHATSDDVPKPSRRAAPVSHLMLGIARPGYDALAKAAETPPADETARQKLRINVSLLNEFAFSLNQGDRPVDDGGKKIARVLQQETAALAGELKQQRNADIDARFKAIEGTCQKCHASYKN